MTQGTKTVLEVSFHITTLRHQDTYGSWKFGHKSTGGSKGLLKKDQLFKKLESDL